jgi:hypothetical protein
VDVFLGMTRGFVMPVGAVGLLLSPRHAATIGTAKYAAKFVHASGQLRGDQCVAWVPLPSGWHSEYTAAIRALAERDHWVSSTGNGTDDISVTHTAFMSSLRTVKHVSSHQQITCLPASQTNSEKLTFVTVGFDNLQMAVDPLSEEDEKAFLILLLEELNNLYPVNLGMDIICERFLEDDVFADDTMDRKDLVLIGASHLFNIIKHVNHGSWKVTDLTCPGWHFNQASVAELVERVTAMATDLNWDTADVVFQLSDNSMYLVGGPGHEKELPCKDRYYTYHNGGNLTVADKSVVKDLVVTLNPLLKVPEGSIGNSSSLPLPATGSPRAVVTLITSQTISSPSTYHA